MMDRRSTKVFGKSLVGHFITIDGYISFLGDICTEPDDVLYVESFDSDKHFIHVITTDLVKGKVQIFHDTAPQKKWWSDRLKILF